MDNMDRYKDTETGSAESYSDSRSSNSPTPERFPDSDPSFEVLRQNDSRITGAVPGEDAEFRNAYTVE